MIERNAASYTAGSGEKDPLKAPLYLRALIFDGKCGDFNVDLINEFNDFLSGRAVSKKEGLIVDGAVPAIMPEKILVINASHDDLPTSDETARIFEDLCREKGYDVPAIVVDRKEDLEKEIEGAEEKTLIISQCVDKEVYNTGLSSQLADKGVIIVPGRITAPGSVFSDKDSTYKLLSENGSRWDTVARYRRVPVENKSTKKVVEGIFSAVDELESELDHKTFFVKPHEGGGGLGGFRLTKHNGGYIIPDLSKVTGNNEEIHPTFIDIDAEDINKLREILWIYRLFASDEKMSRNYLKVTLPVVGKEEDKALGILKKYLFASEKKRKNRLAVMTASREEAKKRLVDSIDIFEKKFKKRYTPLVNEHLDFGLWGLRAHYRLSRTGPLLETIYHRVFQLAFTEEGLGYLGSDNISNKQTGDLEILRLGPVNEIMMNAVGGKDALFETLLKGVEALIELDGLLSPEERHHVPVRLQLDLAAVSQRIGEGNADTARGLCLASRWPKFVHNTREWLEDSLEYYSWKRGKNSI